MRGMEWPRLLHQPWQQPLLHLRWQHCPSSWLFSLVIFLAVSIIIPSGLLLCLPEKRPETNSYLCENSISVTFISATFLCGILHKAVININSYYLLDFWLPRLQLSYIKDFLTLLKPDIFHSWGFFRTPQSVAWVRETTNRCFLKASGLHDLLIL